ncbi:FtsK/SpoIIIE domain-containing protein [Streptomyces sp. CA-181903]|uniref:FtsK/SpoIIIE domain-containing protein n=1 Tax=Streptomyces sp. CA-181903 TaxID=3240055 RepID=UPI003D9090E5
MAARKQSAARPVNTATAAEIVPVGRGAFGHWAGRAVPYLSPWVGAAAFPPAAGWATNTMWGGAPMSAGLASAALAVGGAALSTVTWKVAGGNNAFRKFRRLQATASVAAGMGWLTCATAAGPFGHPMLDAWLLGGGLFAASWNVRQLMRNAHDETEDATSGGLGRLAEAIGWEKVKVKDARGSGKGTVSALVEVEPGATVEVAQQGAPRLAAALRVPPAGVIVTPDPEDAGRGRLSLRVADLLRDGVPFVPPQRLGMLPTEPVPVGLYADGEPWTINPFAAEILQHLLVMGVTGAGKSEFARGLLVHLMCRRQMAIFLVDVAKGRQSMGHIKDGLDWFVTEAREAKRLVKALPAAIKARADHLADEGLDEWSPRSSLSAVCVWLEEAADLVDFEELDKIARAARSVGMWLVISLQRATWSNLSTDVRANLQASACFGVNEAADATFCLPDRVTDAGAIPAWGADRPGYAFATGMGIPQERWTTEARSGMGERDVVSALVEAAAAVRDPLDEVTAAALGQAYAQRAHRGTNRLTAGVAEGATPAVSTSVAPAAVSAAVERDVKELEDGVDDDAEEAVAMEIEDAYAEVMGAIPGDPEPDAPYAHLRLEDDVPDVDPDGEMEFEPAARPSTEEARHIVAVELDGWVRGGRLEFEPADLIPAAVAAGRTRSWLMGELKRLTESGVLRHDSYGSYTITESPLVSA